MHKYENSFAEIHLRYSVAEIHDSNWHINHQAAHPTPNVSRQKHAHEHEHED